MTLCDDTSWWATYVYVDYNVAPHRRVTMHRSKFLRPAPGHGSASSRGYSWGLEAWAEASATGHYARIGARRCAPSTNGCGWGYVWHDGCETVYLFVTIPR